MAINVREETFRGFQKKCELSGQTAVECRLGGEVENVLAVNAVANLSGVDALDGEARYFGKVLFSVVYEDAEKRVCRAEKGMEFSASCKGEGVTASLTPKANVAVENLSVRREGASVFVTALLGAEISLYGEESFTYLTDADCVLKREQTPVLTVHLCGGETEAEDEFETEFLGDLLFHTETVSVRKVDCENGFVRAEGEINLGVLALKGENALTSFERLVPFTAEIPCEACSAGSFAEVFVTVGNALLSADTDEEKGRSKICATLALSVECTVYEERILDGIADAFSCDRVLIFDRVEGKCEGAGARLCVTEKVAGKSAISAPVDFSDCFQAVTLQRAEADCILTADGYKAEGLIMATLILLGSDGSHRAVELSLPFSVPVRSDAACKVHVLVCGISARQRQEGEVEVEATLKMCLQEGRSLPYSLLSGMTEGEEIAQTDCAVSVYLPKVGDGLWELSKRLLKAPEEVLASNPDLEFPIKDGQRVVIYRKKKMQV